MFSGLEEEKERLEEKLAQVFFFKYTFMYSIHSYHTFRHQYIRAGWMFMNICQVPTIEGRLKEIRTMMGQHHDEAVGE